VRRGVDCKRGHDQQASSEIALEHCLEAACCLVWEGHLVRDRKGWHGLASHRLLRYQPSAFGGVLKLRARARAQATNKKQKAGL
jgi:hypothetical protein